MQSHRRFVTALALTSALAAVGTAASARLLAPTVDDFFIAGTQPTTIVDPIKPSTECAYCHGFYDPVIEPFSAWRSSMMAQAARDPLFHACMAVAEQDAKFSGDLCIRCHSPGGWLEGHSTPTDGSALTGRDFDGVTCHVCHRLVDPVASPANPADDAAILASLNPVPTSIHTGSMVVDPLDRRRGPFELDPTFSWHEWRKSPFHQESLLCSTCHDVSNPAFARVGGATPSASDSYAPALDGTSHPTGNKYDMFPVERTFSEWQQSSFAVAPIEMGGRFGGNKTAVGTCQDCHMPDASGEGCAPGFGGAYRDDLPVHDFRGANTWVQKAILTLDQTLELYGPTEVSGLTAQEANDAIARNIDFLTKASDMELSLVDGQLKVRVINQTGHKLPTGYPEGRRMWLNVKFFNASGALVMEHGSYNPVRALLRAETTKVYEAHLGLDALMAAAAGMLAGPSFHFAINNKVYFDNRIPPRGFTNAGFEQVQAQPVGAVYADGQYWDDTLFPIPVGAKSAQVSLNYQSTSKEYIDFLRDENRTNNRGRIAYKLWAMHGKSAPVVMDQGSITIP